MREPALPVFMVCIGPAVGLIGFMLLMVGIASRQPKMWKWGAGILAVDAIAVIGFLISASMYAR
jgi:hypothetical protein